MYEKTAWIQGAAPAINALRLNNISEGLFDTYWQTPFLEDAVTDLVYSLGNLVRVDETVVLTLRRRTVLSYLGDDLDEVTVTSYDSDGVTVLSQYTDTLGYSLGDLVSVTRVVTV